MESRSGYWSPITKREWSWHEARDTAGIVR
jgi:hypothetical protein